MDLYKFKGSSAVLLDDVKSPGMYVAKDGIIYRIPSESLEGGRRPFPRHTKISSFLVSLVSDNPWYGISSKED